VLGIINPIARALISYLVQTDSHYCINEIIRPAQLCQVPDHSKGVKNLSVNTYRRRDSLSGCESDKDMHHSVFMRSNLYLAAEHVLEHIAHMLYSYPPVCS